MAQKKRSFFVIGTALFIAALLYAPYYLVYSEGPQQSDAVILMVSADDDARKREMHQLIREGYADYFLIPVYGEIAKIDKGGVLKALQKGLLRHNAISEYAHLYENTHREMLMARELMDAYSLKSAIFVSSPYHMRRVKLMADHIFDKKTYRLSFVPTRYERPWGYLWWTDRLGVKQVLSEYVKLAWFLIYSPFVGDSG